MRDNLQAVIYWDASAVLSVLFQDSFSKEALSWSQKPGIHLISSLTYAEVCAVISKFRRKRVLTDVLIDVSFEALEKGPWRKLNMQPDLSRVKDVASRRDLSSADLWHLALAKSLKEELPELFLLTADQNLKKAALKEGLLPSD